jgi:hypothetical protein
MFGGLLNSPMQSVLSGYHGSLDIVCTAMLLYAGLLPLQKNVNAEKCSKKCAKNASNS